MNLNIRSGHVVINGKRYQGRNVTIINNVVTIDGVTHGGELTGDINVVVNGDVDSIENESGSITAQNVGSITTQSGDVRCGDVFGSIQTMSGDVTCKSVKGSVKTMSGDIRY